MDKNSIIGFVLIGLIIVVFFFINKPTEEQLAEQQRLRDSIALAQQMEKALEEVAMQTAVSISQDTLPQREITYQTIENSVLRLTLSSQGAAMHKAELKEYHTFKDTLNPLSLFEGDEHKTSFTFITQNNHRIETGKSFFEFIETNDPQKAVLRLPLDSAAWLDFVYTLKENDYMFTLEIVPHNAKNIFAKNITYVPVTWEQDIPQQERGRKFEERYAQLQYMFSDGDIDKLSESKNDGQRETAPLKWIAYKDQFFSTVMIAQTPFQGATVESQMKDRSTGYIKHYSATTQVPFDPVNQTPIAFQYYIGPNHYNTLKAYDEDKPSSEKLYLKELVPLGWKFVSWINKILVIPMFDLLSSWQLNIGLIILIMTVVIKIIIFPFVFKGYKSSAVMRALKPEIDAINAKIPQEKVQERQQATMALYQKVGVSPMSGCLPMLFQFPIVMAMFWFFPTAIELRGKSFLWAEDLSTYDAIISWNANIPLLGDHLSLFCLLMTAVNVIYTHLNMQSQSMGNEMKVMKYMMYFMPVMFLFIFNDYAAGLSYYYFISLLITILQTVFFRFSVNDQELLEKMQAKASRKNAKKSGFMARLEEMQRRQQQMMKENAKKKK